jgi:hypothetical protein
MHATTAPKSRERGFTINLGPAPQRGNLFSIADQIGMAAAADKRQERRKMKQKRKARNWRPD